VTSSLVTAAADSVKSGAGEWHPTRVPLVGIAVNATLAVVKIVAGTLGNSYALIADGIESTTDIVTSLVVWGGLRIAYFPPDEEHPYGYGKADALAGLFAAIALLGAALAIAYQAIHEILTPHHAPHWSTLIVLAGVIVVKEGLARWMDTIAAKHESTCIRSDVLHHRSDALTSLAAFLGISTALLGGPGFESADDWATLAAVGVIGYNGLSLLRTGIKDLLDAAPPENFQEQVRALAAQVVGVRAIEKCRLRKSGLAYLAEIHVQVDGAMSVREAHRVGGQVRSALRASPFRILDVIIHIEPFED
jgi:cation diffusion facilitator family transporter